MSQNHNLPFTCVGKSVQYFCRTNTTVLQWIVLPLNNATVPNIRPNVIDNSGEFFNDGNIVGRIVSPRPLVSSLTITSNSSFERAIVICRPQSGPDDNFEFNSGGKYKMYVC